MSRGGDRAIQQVYHCLPVLSGIGVGRHGRGGLASGRLLPLSPGLPTGLGRSDRAAGAQDAAERREPLQTLPEAIHEDLGRQGQHRVS